MPQPSAPTRPGCSTGYEQADPPPGCGPHGLVHRAVRVPQLLADRRCRQPQQASGQHSGGRPRLHQGTGRGADGRRCRPGALGRLQGQLQAPARIPGGRVVRSHHRLLLVLVRNRRRGANLQRPAHRTRPEARAPPAARPAPHQGAQREHHAHAHQATAAGRHAGARHPPRGCRRPRPSRRCCVGDGELPVLRPHATRGTQSGERARDLGSPERGTGQALAPTQLPRALLPGVDVQGGHRVDRSGQRSDKSCLPPAHVAPSPQHDQPEALQLRGVALRWQHRARAAGVVQHGVRAAGARSGRADPGWRRQRVRLQPAAPTRPARSHHVLLPRRRGVGQGQARVGQVGHRPTGRVRIAAPDGARGGRDRQQRHRDDAPRLRRSSR